MHCFMYFSLVMLEGKLALEGLIISPVSSTKANTKIFALFSCDSQYDGFF